MDRPNAEGNKNADADASISPTVARCYYLPVVGCRAINSCSPRIRTPKRTRATRSNRVSTLGGLQPLPVPDDTGLNPFPKYAVGTVIFDLRKPNSVIIHHYCSKLLRANAEDLYRWNAPKVSAHYVICKDGTIHHMLNDYLRAGAGGISKWGNNTDINSSSIGIELDNNGFESLCRAADG